MSKSRSRASRANGAKSHGPVTPEGRARSAQLQREWRPDRSAENALLDQMIICAWCLRRIWQTGEMQKDRGEYDRQANLQNEPKPADGEPILQNEPTPAAGPANLQNEPESGAAKPKFPNELVPGRGQLIEISQGGEVISLLRPELES